MGWGGSKRKRRFALSAAHRYLRPDLIAISCKDLLTLKSFLPVSCSHFEVPPHYISPSLRASSLSHKAGLWRTRWQRKGPSSTPNSRSLYLSPGFSSCPHALEALFWKALSFCSCSTSPPQVFQSIIVSLFIYDSQTFISSPRLLCIQLCAGTSQLHKFKPNSSFPPLNLAQLPCLVHLQSYGMWQHCVPIWPGQKPRHHFFLKI